ncbi:MAG: pyrroline-5-carboxylate reductase [Gammaproteobacteria bacterium]|nr:pyrroline-5-carboxylate reductase [Gammaproteobacteria bacterium]
MEHLTIGFIGGGNMAASLIGGLLEDGVVSEQIRVSDSNSERSTLLHHRFGITPIEDNRRLVEEVDVVILAVKPQVIADVCHEISEIVQLQIPLIISIAAGIRASHIANWLGDKVAVVRTMPNTPAMIRTGATALYANTHVSKRQREQAEAIMRSVGLTLWVEKEPDLDAVTALSGSGPAYLFLFIEELQLAGESLGLSAETARLLALQTAFGATKMALESDESCATLRRQVTSPGGTTERAIQVFESGGLQALVTSALTAARDRARQLGDELGDKAK